MYQIRENPYSVFKYVVLKDGKYDDQFRTMAEARTYVDSFQKRSVKKALSKL